MSGIKCFTIVLTVCLLAMATIYFLPVSEYGPATVEIVPETFTETAEAIDNPDRGLYSIFGFYITDRETDYQKEVDRLFQDDDKINLAMIQINLAAYVDRDISPEGLQNISKLFAALRTQKQNLIVRFTYDWENEAEVTEPESIDIIIHHMAQLKNVLQANEDRIFVIQGLFTGKWGEMNSARYNSPEDIRCLSEMLLQVTGESTFLAVRTGSQWRTVTGLGETGKMTGESVPRIGLYNDGMMGNIGDCGTYNANEFSDNDPLARWSREKELDFQDVLCRYVPNGGEVIISNSLNDFDNALATLKQMHVSYLNYDYDREVLEKWAAVTVEKGVYRGLDGLTYIARHLGYRILINDVKSAYNPQRQTMILDLELKNVGFAPLYEEKDIVLQFYDSNGKLIYTHEFEEDIRRLYGGNDFSDLLELHHEISLENWPDGEYGVYLAVRDPVTGELLVLANEQTMTQHGYKIAGMKRS